MYKLRVWVALHRSVPQIQACKLTLTAVLRRAKHLHKETFLKVIGHLWEISMCSPVILLSQHVHLLWGHSPTRMEPSRSDQPRKDALEYVKAHRSISTTTPMSHSWSLRGSSGYQGDGCKRVASQHHRRNLLHAAHDHWLYKLLDFCAGGICKSSLMLKSLLWVTDSVYVHSAVGALNRR